MKLQHFTGSQGQPLLESLEPRLLLSVATLEVLEPSTVQPASNSLGAIANENTRSADCCEGAPFGWNGSVDSSSQDFLLGVDASSHITWSAFPGHDWTFGYCKATEGVGWIDPDFFPNISDAADMGVPVGAYHFARPVPNSDLAEEEAQTFANAFNQARQEYSDAVFLRPALDVEDYLAAGEYPYTMGSVALSQWIDTWMQEVERLTGVEPLLYVNSWYAGSSPASWSFESYLTSYDLWVAHWTVAPAPNTGIWSDWAFWQYAGDQTVPGVGVVDYDRFNGDYERLLSEFAIGQATDTLPPTVDDFYVTPTTVNLGETVTISYSVSDTGGSGLKQVELWRTEDMGGHPGPWPEHPEQVVSLMGSGNGPSVGYFLDTPPALGDWWYGLHVVDNEGNWSVEPDPPGPISVTVVSGLAAEITVLAENTYEIADGDSTPSEVDGTDFGAAEHGGAAPWTSFTVRNDGDGVLSLGAVQLPAGFALMDDLVGSLAPGERDVFAVVLDTSTPPGLKMGEVVIPNNDPNENPFNFMIQGEVTSQQADETPPAPNPSTWDLAPYATGLYSIRMVATMASDPSGVEYFFDCTSGGGHNSGWQDGAGYEDTGLLASTSYTYRVCTRDKSPSQNVGGWSVALSATTGAATTVTVAAVDSIACEPINNGRYRISRTGPTASALAVNFNAPTGTATRGVDYSLRKGSTYITANCVTIDAGEAYVDVTLEVLDDFAHEPIETATLTLAGGSGYDVGSPASATINVFDDDPLTEVHWIGGHDRHWENIENWSEGVTPGVGITAVFDDMATYQPALYEEEYALGVDFCTAGWTLSYDGLTLNVGSGGIDSAGSGTNTVDPNVALADDSTWTIGNENTLVLNGALSGGDHVLTKDGEGTLVLNGGQDHATGLSLTIDGGTVRLGDSQTLVLESLAIGSALDLTTGNLVLDYTTPPAGDYSDDFLEVEAWVKSGFKDGPGGYWDGPGIQ